jgi:RNA polymerase sigma factor (TIGR02999 family)
MDFQSPSAFQDACERHAQGDPRALDDLIVQVYHELRRIAQSLLMNESASQTLQATALVHEALLRLEKSEGRVITDRRHLVNLFALAMRRCLTDRARHKNTLKAGGDLQRQSLHPGIEGKISLPVRDEFTDRQIDNVNDALDELKREEPECAEVITLKYYGGLTSEAISAATGLSSATVTRYLRFGREWLHDAVKKRDANFR